MVTVEVLLQENNLTLASAISKRQAQEAENKPSQPTVRAHLYAAETSRAKDTSIPLPTCPGCGATAHLAGRSQCRWKSGQRCLKQFWKLWRNEYLLSLREWGQIWHKKSKGALAQVPKIGNVVLLKEKLPQEQWKVGRINKLI